MKNHSPAKICAREKSFTSCTRERRRIYSRKILVSIRNIRLPATPELYAGDPRTSTWCQDLQVSLQQHTGMFLVISFSNVSQVHRYSESPLHINPVAESGFFLRPNWMMMTLYSLFYGFLGNTIFLHEPALDKPVQELYSLFTGYRMGGATAAGVKPP
jgi:hypothetical protein